MSSNPAVINHNDADTLIGRFVDNAQASGNRAMIVLRATPAGWLEQLASHYDCTYIAEESNVDRGDRINALLGTERDMAVVELSHKPDLGLLAAAAGTIRAGGVIIIGTGARSDYRKPGQTETSLYAHETSHSTRRLQNLAASLSVSYPHIIAYLQTASAECTTTGATRIDSRCSDSVATYNRFKPVIPAAVEHQTNAAAEQDRLLETSCRHLSDHDNTLVVITGRRGRGKSTLLARIALYLETSGKDFRVTAMSRSALYSLGRNHGTTIIDRFVCSEDASLSACETLLVDEAASLSLNLLQHYARHCRHLILCSTTEGYEASGRAFDIRFMSELDGFGKAVLHVEPKLPWRWQADDPLEQFIDQLLINHCRKTEAISVIDRYRNPRIASAGCVIKRITQKELVENEAKLAAVHNLLCDAHYQSSTKDLTHLLDAPSLHLWAQILDNQVVGVLLMEAEGQIDPELHDDIVARRRRLPNQLLPQLLAQTADNGAALHLAFARVVRVAVIPQLRRQGLATALVEAASKALINPTRTAYSIAGFDAIGASFASDAGSVAFWKQLEFKEFHRGFRANPRTGKTAVTVLRCNDEVVSRVLSEAIAIHEDNQQARMGAVSWLSSAAVPSARDQRLLRRFADGERSMHDTQAALQRLVGDVDRRPGKSQKQHELELRVTVQQRLNALRGS